jgi:quinol monooxygenase YgiN
MSILVKTVGILTARQGKGDDLKALLLGMTVACRSEPGNLRWDVWQDQADVGRFVLDELYKDAAAVSAHRKTAHFMNYASRVEDLAERAVFLLNSVDIV